jgi:hypothetical protein
MPRVVFGDSWGAFMDWEIEGREGATWDLPRKHRDEFARTSKGEYCCQCGKLIPRGERVYCMLVYQEPFGQRVVFRPFHEKQCIPHLELHIIPDASRPEDAWIFKNSELVCIFVDYLNGGSLSARTVHDVEMFARFFTGQIAPLWDYCEIYQEGVLVGRYTQEEIREKTDAK